MANRDELERAAKVLGLETSGPCVDESTGRLYSKLRLRIGSNLLRAVVLGGDSTVPSEPREHLRVYHSDEER